MADTTGQRMKRLQRGYEIPSGFGEWGRVTLPSLGAVTQCPECGSTDTTVD